MTGTNTRVACLSCPEEGLSPDRRAEVHSWLRDSNAQLLITSELPFCEWLARSSSFDGAAASRSISDAAEGMEWLSGLPVPNVISSRPARGLTRLRNEAILLGKGAIRPSHSKRYLPDEPGWSEAVWFDRGHDTPRQFDLQSMKAGVLLCTEVMFPEDARALGVSGLDLIAVPRATGPHPMWRSALAMAAISSGAHVISVNRLGGVFSGGALAFTPDGEELEPVQQHPRYSLFEIDIRQSQFAKLSYPRNVFSRN